MKFLENLNKLPPLNLRLGISKSLLVEVETRLSQQSNHTQQCRAQTYEMTRSKRADFVSQQMTEKMKASNFPALELRIGSWERVTRHEGDLVAKSYYAKKKLVWEFLEKSLKRKIEIQWADIIGIRATAEENEPGILELELKQPPTFHHEIDPQPRKHTNWRLTEDFTGGQAPVFRKHYLKFPPGVLDRHFEKLLQCDSRLFELSRKPFPTLDSPYFHQSCIFEHPQYLLSFNGQSPQIYHGLHSSHSHMSPPLFPAQQFLSPPQVQSHQMQVQPPSFSFKDLSSPDSAGHVGNNHYVDNPGMRFWGQATNSFPANQVRGFASSTTPTVVSYQNNNYNEGGSGGRGGLYDQILIESVENTLLSDLHIDYSNEECSIPRMASHEALTNRQANYGQDMSAASSGDMEVSASEHSNDTAGHFHTQAATWMLPQGNENIPRSLTWLPAQATTSQEMPMPMSQYRNSLAYLMQDDFT
ncbi:ATP-dependent DNA helicase [Citrus sinensis]|nr:ATP-dependent DNA helicase [Citrus sinensis]